MAEDSIQIRLLAGTRGKIIRMLRRKSHTVDELASALEITTNAVRVQLALLERDGLVYQHGVRRRGGKPAHYYRLTDEAEKLFPKAHELVLRELLNVLEARSGAEQEEEMFRTVGRRIADRNQLSGDSVRSRLDQAAHVLNSLGGLMQIEEGEDSLHVCGYQCPLSDLASTHPSACKMMETLLTEMVHVPIHERCERSEPLRCWLEVRAPAG
jgi:predicted ArsR family transcriptional regulator